MDVEKNYHYGPNFEIGVLALLAQDPGFRANFEDVIKPAYFTSEPMSSLCRLILDIHRKGKVVSPDALQAELVDYCSLFNVGDATRNHLLNLARQVYQTNIDFLDYIPDRAVHFARRQACADALTRMVEMMQEDKDPESLRNVLDTALQVGAARDLGIDIHESVARLGALLAESSMDESRKIPTGLPSLDTAMRGGLGAGQLGMILGPTGRGKSIVLVNLAACALRAGKKVCYVTFELTEVEVLVRMLQRLTGCIDTDVIKQTEDFKKKITVVNQKTHKFLKIKYYAPGTITTGQLRAYIARLKSHENWTPDLLILDDGDSFRVPLARGGDASAATYYAQGQTYTEIISIINDYKSCCWAATQATRAAYDMETVTVGQTAESFKKVHRAQAALAVCQTKQEAATEIARLYVAKGRGFRDGFYVPIKFHKNIMCIEELPPPSPGDTTGKMDLSNTPQTIADLEAMVGQAPEKDVVDSSAA